jgi:hypothetical protein
LERELSFQQGRLDGLSKYYLPNRVGIEIQFSGDTAVSGYCVGQTGTKTPLTHPETVYTVKGLRLEKVCCLGSGIALSHFFC